MSSAKSPLATLTGLHLLLTYRCNYDCDHCFVWGGPTQRGSMSEDSILNILEQAEQAGSIEWIYFEGGEPFLDYPLLCFGVKAAKTRGFRVGIVSNGYWATSETEARERLRPFAGLVEDLSISEDAYHGVKGGDADDGDARGGAGKAGRNQTQLAREAAEYWSIPVDFIQVEGAELHAAPGELASGESTVLYRGRAAETLAAQIQPQQWQQFTKCPWEELRNPERVHVDAFGHLHICQGISIGNLFERPLIDIMNNHDPEGHPVIGPLLDGGPAEIVNRYELPHRQGYADACHLCYQSRCQLRERFGDVLTPDAMYGS